jgi:hypothetical protein
MMLLNGMTDIEINIAFDLIQLGIWDENDFQYYIDTVWHEGCDTGKVIKKDHTMTYHAGMN